MYLNIGEKERRDTIQFIHVSSLINQKNPEGNAEALSLVKKKRSDFVLKIIGPAKEKLEKSYLNFHLKRK